jgi:hypothetical protein
LGQNEGFGTVVGVVRALAVPVHELKMCLGRGDLIPERKANCAAGSGQHGIVSALDV